jgi:hypothetical protein
VWVTTGREIAAVLPEHHYDAFVADIARGGAMSMACLRSYLQYPRRRHGMDHDRYDWSMLPRRPPVQWPGGALALWVNVALQWFPLEPAGQALQAAGRHDRPPIPTCATTRCATTATASASTGS